jgi:Multiubiquitin
MNNVENIDSKKESKEKEYEIIVNGRPKVWTDKEISFSQVVEFAFGSYQENGQTVFTMTYKRGQGNKPDGEMVAGDSVKVKDKMIFNVTSTDKS